MTGVIPDGMRERLPRAGDERAADAVSVTAPSRRIASIENAFESERATSRGLTALGAGLAGVSALAILGVAGFASVWLDDSQWALADIPKLALTIASGASIAGFAISVLFGAGLAMPRGSLRHRSQDHLAALAEGKVAAAATELLRMTVIQRRRNGRKALALKVASPFFAVAVAAVAAQGALFLLEADVVERQRTSVAAPVVEPAETGLPPAGKRQALAEAFAPRVRLHPREEFGPQSPERFIARSTLVWQVNRDATVAGRGKVEPARLGAGCGEDCYAFPSPGGFLSRELTRPFHQSAERPPDLRRSHGFALDAADDAFAGQAGRDPDLPVYWEMRPAGTRVLITYWLFYGFSTPHIGLAGPLRGAISHEGDWENIDVALRADDLEPVRVYFYGHGHPSTIDWAAADKVGADGAPCEGSECHPVVWSAWDSHASYAKQGRTKTCGSGGCACDVRAPGATWDTWLEGRVRPVRDEPWYGFGGAWGAAGPTEGNTGPLGPSSYKLPADPDPGDQAATPASC